MRSKRLYCFIIYYNYLYFVQEGSVSETQNIKQELNIFLQTVL